MAIQPRVVVIKCDVSILLLRNNFISPIIGDDTRQNTRKGQRWIKPMQTVKAGRPFGRPYPPLFNFP